MEELSVFDVWRFKIVPVRCDPTFFARANL